jgi:acyl dehydratase
VDLDGNVHAGAGMSERRDHTLTLTPALLRAYSRRGNFHSDPAAAREAGLSEPVAQGMQAAAPAYAVLLDAWGDEWLASGALEVTFVGMVQGGETVRAVVDLDGDQAELEVSDAASGATRVVGHASRRAGPSGH